MVAEEHVRPQDLRKRIEVWSHRYGCAYYRDEVTAYPEVGPDPPSDTIRQQAERDAERITHEHRAPIKTGLLLVLPMAYRAVLVQLAHMLQVIRATDEEVTFVTERTREMPDAVKLVAFPICHLAKVDDHCHATFRTMVFH